MSSHSELQPYIMIRIADGVAECATWQVHDGGRALALFLTEESAQRYRQAAQLSDEWQIVRPPRRGLWELLQTSHSHGVGWAAVDPDASQAVRVVSISEILLVMQELP